MAWNRTGFIHGRKVMLKILTLLSAIGFTAVQAWPAAAVVVSGVSLLPSPMIVPVQGRGDGRGPGRGARNACPDRCRTVVVPGSGRGPQQVCKPVAPRCRTVVVPGSGRGPQEVC